MSGRGKSRAGALLGAIWRRLDASLHRARLRSRTRHLHGPRRVHLRDDDCAMVSMVRDAAYFIDELIRHHQALGVRHILLIDNGSEDDTVARAQKYDNVTILRNTLPVARYETLFRSVLPKRVFSGGWILFVDSDEMLTLPAAREGMLADLLRYCNRMGHTAVVAQMLDMISARPLAETRALSYRDSLDAFSYYSLQNIDRMPFDSTGIEIHWFLSHNTNTNPAVMIHHGGIRYTLFGEWCCLTKQPLVRNLPGVILSAHPHCAQNVTYADLTILLRHYKLCGDLPGRDRRQVALGTWGHGEDRARVEKLDDDAGFVLDGPGRARFGGPGPLLDAGFLVRSDRAAAELKLGPAGD